MKEFLRTVAFGIIIGIANAIPGVSGGTMAVVLGVYDKLIGGMSRFFDDVKGNIKFLSGIGIGAGLGIYYFGSIIKYCISNYAMSTNFFFSGLILGSLPMIYSKARSLGKASARHYGTLLIVIGLMAALAFYSGGGSDELITQLTPEIALYMVFASMIAAIGMLLPGVSGSMILLMFGLYFSVMTGVTDMNIILLSPVAIGVGLGLLVGAKIIDFCLLRMPLFTYYAILGLVIGSLITVVKNAFDDEPSLVNIIVSSLVFLLGTGISLAFERWNKTIEKPAKSA